MSPNRLDHPGSPPAADPDETPIQIMALDVLGDRLERAASASIAQRQRASRAPWAWGLAVAPALAVLGIALGVARERSGTLLVPMVAHAAFNGANLLILLWRPSPILPAS